MSIMAFTVRVMHGNGVQIQELPLSFIAPLVQPGPC